MGVAGVAGALEASGMVEQERGEWEMEEKEKGEKEKGRVVEE